MPIQDATSIYPAGLRSAYVDNPPDGLAVPIRAAHHVEILDRQRMVYRAYPEVQALTCGRFDGTTHGLFQAPPNAEAFSVRLVCAESEITADTTFTLTYNSTAKTKKIAMYTDQNSTPFYQVQIGPWQLASATTDAPALVLVSFAVDTGTPRIFGLYARFTISGA